MKKLLLSALLACCGGVIQPDEQTAQPNDRAQCEAAAKNVCTLQCKSRTGDPLCTTPSGTPFADVCTRAYYSWNPEQLAKAKTCDEVDRIFRGRR